MDGITAYKDNSISTQSRGRLIVLLYEGAIKFLKQAIKELEAHNHLEKGKYITKAMAIIDELNYCLDMEVGGEVAENLRSLYVFMNKHLGQANIKCSAQQVREVIALLEELNEAWKAITA